MRPVKRDELRVHTEHRGRNWRVISPYYILFFSHQQLFSSLLTVCTAFTLKARNIYTRRQALGPTERRASAVTVPNVWLVRYRWVFLIFCCIWQCSEQFNYGCSESNLRTSLRQMDHCVTCNRYTSMTWSINHYDYIMTFIFTVSHDLGDATSVISVSWLDFLHSKLIFGVVLHTI